MIEKTGNLFTSTAPAIGHGVNIDGVMGAGIAVQFRTLLPEMHRQYLAVCQKGWLHPGEVFAYEPPHGPLVYNIASQDRPGANARLEWLEDGLRNTVFDAEIRGFDRVALPHIGCGIGGLDLRDVKALMLDVEQGSSVQFEVWAFTL